MPATRRHRDRPRCTVAAPLRLHALCLCIGAGAVPRVVGRCTCARPGAAPLRPHALCLCAQDPWRSTRSHRVPVFFCVYMCVACSRAQREASMAGAGTGTCATATAHTDSVQRDLREIHIRALVGNAPPVAGGRHVKLKLRDAAGTALGEVQVPLDAKDSHADRGRAVTSWPFTMSLAALANLGEGETVDARLLTKKQRQRYFGVLGQDNKVAQIEPAEAGFASELAAILTCTARDSAGKDAAIKIARRIAAGEVHVCTFARLPMCPCP